MKPHDRLTIIRNRHRARDLRIFRERVRVYFELFEYDTRDVPVDWDAVRAARAEIHRMLPRVAQIVQAADLGASAVASPRSTAGRAVEILHEIFSDRYARGEYQEILDVIDMAVGVYDATRYGAWLRTVNPFHYVSAALGFVAGLPYRGLVAIGLLRPRSAHARPGGLKGLDAALERLAGTEALIDRRFAEMREWQSRLFAESTGQLTDLAERMDFVERVLAQPGTLQRLQPGERRVRTPV
jgi:hypothetical protein